MMRPLAIVLAMSLSAIACSNDPPKETAVQPEEWHPPAEMLDKYSDRNGTVTRNALEKGLRADFDKADVDHNGCLNENEVRAINQERWTKDASTASPLIDFKHAGCIDFEEFVAAPLSLFDQLDKHGKGRLTRAQLHPGHGNATQTPP